MSVKMLLSYIFVFISGIVLSTLINFGTEPEVTIIESNRGLDQSADTGKTNNQPENSYIESLHQLIAEYQAKLADLEDDNKSLFNDLLDSEGKLSAVVSKPTISKKIASMSDDDIYEKIGQVFKESYLENVDNPKAFAQRLTDIALTDEDEKSTNESGVANSEVRISISQNPGYQEMTSDQVVVSQYRRLYVNMTSSLPVPNGLIKWKNLSEDKIIMFRGLTFHSNNDSQYVWVRPKSDDGWQRGLYQVSVYQINNELTLLATKNYTVSEVIDEGPEEVPEVPHVDGPPLKLQRQ